MLDLTGASIALDGDAVGSSGVKTIEPQSDTTYRLVVNSLFGLKHDKSITVHVRDTIVEFEIQPDRITSGESAKLVWKTNAPMVKIAGDYEYTVKATGPGGEVTRAVSIKVSNDVPPRLAVIVDRRETVAGEEELTQVKDLLTNHLKNIYAIVRADIEPMSAEQYLASLQSDPKQVLPTFISLATVRLFRNLRPTHFHGLRLDVQASATIKLLQVNGSTLVEMTAGSGEGRMKDIAYPPRPGLFAGPSEREAVGDALMQALNQLSTGR